MKSITSKLNDEGIIVILGQIRTFGGGICIEPNFSGSSLEREEIVYEQGCAKFFEKYNRFKNSELRFDLSDLKMGDYSGVIVYIDSRSKKPLEIIDPYLQQIIWKQE